MPPWLGLILLVLPVIAVATFGTRQVRESDAGRTSDGPAAVVPAGWLAARGVVVDERTWRRRRRRIPDGSMQPIRQPVITFQSADGREITFTSRIHAAGMPRPGALVGVFHDPVDPTRACIAPESLAQISRPMGKAARVMVGLIWSAATVTTLLFVIVLFDV